MVDSKTKYFTQRRIAMPGNPGSFTKICDGHTDIYEAMRCAERARATFLGIDRKDSVHPIIEAMDADIRAEYLKIIALGGTVELCVAKFTVTREVIEDIGFIVAEKIKPKKEVP